MQQINQEKQVIIDKNYVQNNLGNLVKTLIYQNLFYDLLSFIIRAPSPPSRNSALLISIIFCEGFRFELNIIQVLNISIFYNLFEIKVYFSFVEWIPFPVINKISCIFVEQKRIISLTFNFCICVIKTMKIKLISLFFLIF